MEQLKFDDIPWKILVSEDDMLQVFQDKYPVTPGHLLFVPRKHDTDGIGYAFHAAFISGKEAQRLGKCDAFNVGMNYGESAGQSVGWPHVHLILRNKGDTAEPKGGIRNCIPGKGNYDIKEEDIVKVK